MGSGYSLYQLPCLFACDPLCPEPEGQGSRSGQTPVETINIVTEQPSQPDTRYNAIADTGPPHATTGTMTARSAPDASRLWLPHATRHPCSHPIAQQAYRTSTPPTAQIRNASQQNFIVAIPRAVSASTPPSSCLGSEDSPTIACAQGQRKLFREAQEHRGPGGGLGARLGQHRLHHRERRGARLRGRRRQCGGYDMPREEPDQERFERIAAAYLVESEVEGLTGIRYDIVSLLVTGSEKALLHHHKNVLNDRR